MRRELNGEAKGQIYLKDLPSSLPPLGNYLGKLLSFAQRQHLSRLPVPCYHCPSSPPPSHYRRTPTLHCRRIIRDRRHPDPLWCTVREIPVWQTDRRYHAPCTVFAAARAQGVLAMFDVDQRVGRWHAGQIHAVQALLPSHDHGYEAEAEHAGGSEEVS